MVIGAPGPDGRAETAQSPAVFDWPAVVAAPAAVVAPADPAEIDAGPVSAPVAADPSPEVFFTASTKATPTQLAVARSAGAKAGRDKRLPNPRGAPFVAGVLLPALGPMLTAGVAQDESAIGKAVAPAILYPDEAAAWEQGFADAHRERLHQQFLARAAGGSLAGLLFWIVVAQAL